jgi:hypothetical protein
MPESLSDAGKPKSYVVVLDCSSEPLGIGEPPIVNIAARTDIELFRALRLWQGLPSKSFTGAIKAFLVPRSVRLELKFVGTDILGQ